MEEIILDNPRENGLPRRRNLLPLWIKIFIWLCLVVGVVTPLAYLIGIISGQGRYALYGLESNDPYSMVALSISALFAFKGVVAYGLWFEKDWAVKYAQIDAIIGIIICFLSMVILPFVTDFVQFGIRFEFILLIPYYLKMIRIQKEWTARGIF